MAILLFSGNVFSSAGMRKQVLRKQDPGFRSHTVVDKNPTPPLG